MKKENNHDVNSFWKFFIPSVAGVILFLVPFTIDGEVTLLINLLINKTKSLAGSALLPFVLIVLGISAIFSLIAYSKKNFFKGYWKSIFLTNLPNLFIRVLAFILSILIYFKIGPEVIWSDYTGGLMLYHVVANLIPFFFWAGLFLPLLTEFGLIEFIGNLARPIMRPLFKIPGRAAINCAVVLVGSGTMGIVLTNKEYENGFYTKKEAISIATGFSIASIAIVSLLASFLHMAAYFPLIYISVIVIGSIVNVIMVRIPPISNKPSEFFEEAPKRNTKEEIPEGYSAIAYSVKAAKERANEDKPNLVISGLKITADVWFTLEPMVLTIGTIATIIAEYTSLFAIISMPLAFLMNLLGLQEATLAAQGITLGFVDIFLPFIFGGSITSLATKFVIAVVCLIQIIFITETGPLLLKLKMGIKSYDIVLIFVLRTILALLLVTPLAYIIF